MLQAREEGLDLRARALEALAQALGVGGVEELEALITIDDGLVLVVLEVEQGSEAFVLL